MSPGNSNNMVIISECVKTTGGNGGGACCAFPFQYKGKTYTKCTQDDNDKLWCGTTKDSSKWGECVTGIFVCPCIVNSND